MIHFITKNWLPILCALLFTIVAVFEYIQPKSEKLVSPWENFPKLSIADNLWFPKNSVFAFKEKVELPKLTSEAAFFVEAKTGEVLYEKNAHVRLPIASLTKIMTAILVMENRQLNEQLSVSREAAAMEPDKMYLKYGEKLTVEELLQGLFLVSGNDAAEVFAERTTGRREEFINMMNAKAKLLGMNNTHFINPSGLEEDFKSQYSTAYDVALMSRYAVSHFPVLLQITSKPHIVIPETKTHQEYDLYSGINLLTSYPGVLGFKTGFTPEAGLTLVTYAQRDGHDVLGVLLNATDRRDDAKMLLDYSFNKLQNKAK